MSTPLTLEEKAVINANEKAYDTDIHTAMVYAFIDGHNSRDEEAAILRDRIVSLSTEIVKINKQNAAKDERIKELELHIDKLATQGVCELSKMEKEKDAYIEALEKTILSLNELFKTKNTACENSIKERNQLLEKVEQLGKLVALFKEVPYGSAYVHVSDYCLAVGRILEKRDTLLSSRENKK